MKKPAERAFDGTAWLLASFFGCGLMPIAPGTAGSLAALAVAYGLSRGCGWRGWELGLMTVALVPLAVWSASRISASTGDDDPSIVVIDEVVGQWLAALGALPKGWVAWLWAWLWFRIVDVIKPPPIRRLEAMPGGWGIVADDLLAGAYAGGLVWLTGYLGWI